jgi:NCAIR mutase (PurE)-related protein
VDEAALRDLLDDVRSGIVDPDEAVAMLRRLPFADLGFARVDHHRAIRSGLPEAIYGPGKTPEQCVAIVAELLAAGTRPVLLTRVDDDQAVAALAAHPTGRRNGNTIVWNPLNADRREQVLVITAGTSDLPVADECAAVLDAHGVAATRITDAGVAGVHRLLVHTEELSRADVVVVVAGMEGALASPSEAPHPRLRIAAPTSVRYGAASRDHCARRCMPRAAGVTAVGIDNGWRRARRPALQRPRPRTIDPHVTNVAWFHCFSGIAGDMALGSLIDAGADLDEVREICSRIPVGGWKLEAEPVLRGGIGATHVIVHTEESGVVRTAGHIAGLIEEARLPDRVRVRALATFDALARAEGRLHRRPPEQVHFHEVGGLDAT